MLNKDTNINIIMYKCSIGKYGALSHKVTCNFSLYLEIGRTSVKPILKHWKLMSKLLSTHRSTL